VVGTIKEFHDVQPPGGSYRIDAEAFGTSEKRMAIVKSVLGEDLL
jgi:hypothetical protein